MVNKFGKDFQSILRKDFGLSNFDGFKKRIFSDFKTSITYWVNNRYYDVSQSNFGKPSDIRFEECEQYSFQTLLDEIQIILRNCIEYHTKTLKRRDITIKALPKEFEITQLKKDVKDLVGNININENRVRNVYNPANVDLKVTGTKTINPPVQIIPTPEIKIQPIELPIIKIEPTPQPIKPIESTPILVIEPTPEPKVEPIQDVIPTPSIGGGGGSVRTFEDPRQNDSGLYDYGRNISDRGRVEEYT
jgi:hypothetical protein